MEKDQNNKVVNKENFIQTSTKEVLLHVHPQLEKHKIIVKI